MYYVCVENNQIVSMLDYEPNVPSSVTVTTITDDEYGLISKEKTHYFDVESNTVKIHGEEVFSHREVEAQNRIYQRFLKDTDWKVMRHIREKALAKTTTLSDEEYTDLETQRDTAAAGIIH
jgi:hypothetical protein